jgi:hypothetical protein
MHHGHPVDTLIGCAIAETLCYCICPVAPAKSHGPEATVWNLLPVSFSVNEHDFTGFVEEIVNVGVFGGQGLVVELSMSPAQFGIGRHF